MLQRHISSTATTATTPTSSGVKTSQIFVPGLDASMQGISYCGGWRLGPGLIMGSLAPVLRATELRRRISRCGALCHWTSSHYDKHALTMCNPPPRPPTPHAPPLAAAVEDSAAIDLSVRAGAHSHTVKPTGKPRLAMKPQTRRNRAHGQLIMADNICMPLPHVCAAVAVCACCISARGEAADASARGH